MQATRARGRPGTSALRHLDLTLLLSTIGIAAVGLVMVYSATRQKQESAGLDPAFFLKRQAVFLALGLVAMAIVTLVDYHHIRDYAPVIYVVAMVTLLLVISPVGTSRRGTQAWFQIGAFQFQPSEVAKLVLIIALAAVCAAYRGHLETPGLLTALGLAFVPMALIYAQPDLGTNMVFVGIVIAVLLVAGARPRHIAVLALLGITALVLVVELDMLQDYQRDRLTAFLDPQTDTQRSSYNLRQSQIAIAAGGVSGRGLFQGTQTNLSFVPEQHTDFIFTAVGEELGFLGALSLLGLFGVMMWRIWRAAVLARDQLGRLLCVGVLAMLVFQIFENVGMTMGITPITGIPLPFMSYGGSAMITSCMAVGLVLNVHMRRFS
ncbi:MAG TPA: rod shape-determining protein RodA [Acidimicrobiales bacterium]|nr:rod shape-determining protein RodA [Acidimicrobiales bacterium]